MALDVGPLRTGLTDGDREAGEANVVHRMGHAGDAKWQRSRHAATAGWGDGTKMSNMSRRHIVF
jgi:hypothetical protein